MSACSSSFLGQDYLKAAVQSPLQPQSFLAPEVYCLVLEV
jgi:hypothetical protein